MPTTRQIEILATLDELDTVVARFMEFNPHPLICLVGNLGAGKTTLIQSICRHYGYKDPVTSPTFSLINEYFLPDGSKISHLDLYRLENLEEIEHLGLEEIIAKSKICFIEWPEKAEAILPEKLTAIKIEIQQDRQRKYIFVSYQ